MNLFDHCVYLEFTILWFIVLSVNLLDHRVDVESYHP